MMKRRTRRVVLLVLLGILISGTQTADVVAEADDMVKRIDEESKKVEDQSNAMASEIEAKSKTVEDASLKKKFEEASKHVDDVMDEGEKEVDDKANFAEELQNGADKRVDELGKKIEETNSRNGISRKRRASDAVVKGLGTKKTTSGNPGSKRRMTVSYPAELPHEESAGEQIEDAMKDSEPSVKNEDEGTGKDVEHPSTFSGPQDFSDHSNNESEETEDARYQVGETTESFSQPEDFDSSQENGNEETGETYLGRGQPQGVSESQEVGDNDGGEGEEIDATKLENTEENFSAPLNFSDEKEGASTANFNENKNEDLENVMVVKQMGPAVSFADKDDDHEETGEDVAAAEHVNESKDKENTEDTVVVDSVDDKHDDEDDFFFKQKRPDKMGKGDKNEHDGGVYNVDVYQETSNSSSNATKLDQKGAENGTMEGSPTVVQTSSGDGNDTQTENSSQQPKISVGAEGKYNPPVEINFSPSAELLKPDQETMNEMEEDQALRLKQKEKKLHAKELQNLGTTKLGKEFDARWRQLNATNDPEMLLRYPSLGKVIGKTGTNQKVSTITPGEVDLLQTEYPGYMNHGTNGRKVEILVRDSIGNKRKNVPKGKAKKRHLRKLLMKY